MTAREAARVAARAAAEAGTAAAAYAAALILRFGGAPPERNLEAFLLVLPFLLAAHAALAAAGRGRPGDAVRDSALGATATLAAAWILRATAAALPTTTVLLGAALSAAAIAALRRAAEETREVAVLGPAGAVDAARLRLGRPVRWAHPGEEDRPLVDLLLAEARGEAETLRILFAAERAGVEVLALPAAAPGGEAVVAAPLPDRPLVALSVARPAPAVLAAKHLVEVALALLLAPLALAVAAAAALAVWIESGRPVLYRQRRLGLGGRPFDVWKVRTMPPDAEAGTGPVWASEDDPRATPVGRRLRALGLDETPQILQVLTGRMALVGPRPERPEFVARHPELAGLRLAVRPGVTGLAQVRLPKEASPEEKLRYDLWYVRHASPLLDLRILAETAGKVAGRIAASRRLRLTGTGAPRPGRLTPP